MYRYRHHYWLSFLKKMFSYHIIIMNVKMNLLSVVLYGVLIAVWFDVSESFSVGGHANSQTLHRPQSLAYSNGSSLSRPRKMMSSCLKASAEESSSAGVDSSENLTKIDQLLKDLHESSFPFRIVVIGNGAILETTSVLGPHMATSTSAKTGQRLVTLASEDKSFEFHVKVEEVSKVTFTERERPDATKMRICRFQSHDDKPICSLILNDSTSKAETWFQTMTEKYGTELTL